MKRLLMATTLSCILSSLALAGEVPSVLPAPPSIGTTQTLIQTSVGEIPPCDLAEQVSDATVSALLTVFSLLAI